MFLSKSVFFEEEAPAGTYNISTVLVKNILPHMAQQNKLLFPKHSPWSKNSDFGVLVAWDFPKGEFSFRAKESVLLKRHGSVFVTKIAKTEEPTPNISDFF